MSTPMLYENNQEFAFKQDQLDELAKFRNYFHIPQNEHNQDLIYFAGNSLGLMPKTTTKYITEVLNDWQAYGVEGHFKAKHAWMPYHELVQASFMNLTQSSYNEVVAMNSLTANLHLMMVAFYQPTSSKYKILIEENTFPSDKYAVASQASYHGFNPNNAIIEFKSNNDNLVVSIDSIIDTIEKNSDSLSLILIGQPNYLTGQVFDIAPIVGLAQKYNIKIGLNLAHGIGNLDLNLNSLNIDFAVWCSYKYLNSGPGGIAGLFIHEKHHKNSHLPRFSGWWGHNQANRFTMPNNFDPMTGALGFQLSNPPIFQLASLRASLDIFQEAKIARLREKSIKLTGYLEYLINQEFKHKHNINIITPAQPNERGAQLSLKLANAQSNIVENLRAFNLICDFRFPDILRMAPTPLYNSYIDVYNSVKILSKIL